MLDVFVLFKINKLRLPVSLVFLQFRKLTVLLLFKFAHPQASKYFLHEGNKTLPSLLLVTSLSENISINNVQCIQRILPAALIVFSLSLNVMMAAGNLSDVGLDTQEEENEEKARFYAQLEEGALATIDYSVLNRELDSTSSTTATDHRCVDPFSSTHIPGYIICVDI